MDAVDQVRIDTRIAVTAQSLRNFEDALKHHNSSPRPSTIDPILWSAQARAIESQMVDLRVELRELRAQAGQA